MNPRLFLRPLKPRAIAPQPDLIPRDVEGASLPTVSIGDRFGECARLAIETAAAESLALQAAYLKERGDA